MVISQVMAWISLFFCAVTVICIVIGLGKCSRSDHFPRRFFIPLGLLLLTAGAHGVLAGNPADATLETAEPAAVLFTFNWGTISFLSLLLLGAVCLLCNQIPKGRKLIFGGGLALVSVFLCLHLAQVGLHLPERFFETTAPEESPSSTLSSESLLSSSGEEEKLSFSSSIALPEKEDASSLAKSESETQSSEILPGTPVEQGLKDGVYEGSGEGRNGAISVRVTVAEGQITAVEVIDQNETPRFFSQAESIISSILSSQTPEVEVVAGATLSSEGIKAAVADALKDA